MNVKSLKGKNYYSLIKLRVVTAAPVQLCFDPKQRSQITLCDTQSSVLQRYVILDTML